MHIQSKNGSAQGLELSDRTARRALMGLAWFAGITAMLGGLQLILAPQGNQLAPIELLSNTPFTNFLVPGLVLAGIVGLSNLASALLMHRHHRAGELMAFEGGLVLMVWIFAQMTMVHAFGWLQVLYFGIGLATVALAVSLGALSTTINMPTAQPQTE